MKPIMTTDQFQMSINPRGGYDVWLTKEDPKQHRWHFRDKSSAEAWIKEQIEADEEGK